MGSWKNHYNSWKVFRRFNKYLLVRYEDLINKTDKTFLNILKFIAHLGRVKFTYDKKKFENTLKTTGFEKMQKLEAKEVLLRQKKIKNLKKSNFLNTKMIKKLLDKKKKKIRERIRNEMKELNYL